MPFLSSGDLRLRWQLLKVLTGSSWRSRYRNSVLGFLWGVLEPMSMTLIFVLIFSILTRGLYTSTAPYPLFVLLGNVLWSFFAQGTMQGGNGIILRNSLVKKIYFPREYLSFSYVLAILLTSSVNLIVFAALFSSYGLSPSLPALLFPVILALLLLLIIGVSLLLATLFVHAEDLRYFWQLITTLGLFLSPVVYEPAKIPQRLVFWYNLNPMVGILNSSRDVLLYGTWPPLWSLAYPAFTGLVLLALGRFLIRRNEHLFAERL